MSILSAEAFCEDLLTNDALAQELTQCLAGDGSLQEKSDIVARFAALKGYSFSAHQAATLYLRAKQQSALDRDDGAFELNEDELMLISGGFAAVPVVPAFVQGMRLQDESDNQGPTAAFRGW